MAVVAAVTITPQALATPASLAIAAKTETLAASVLPSSRSTTVGETITVFATIINASPGAPAKQLGDTPDARGASHADSDNLSSAKNCRIALRDDLPMHFSFQATDPLTNEPVGTANTPVAVAAGAAQSFVIALSPWAEVAPTDVHFNFSCGDSASARSIVGINTLAFSASTHSVPDLIAMSVSATGSGVAMLRSAEGADNSCSDETAIPPGTVCEVGAFSLAAVNIGEASESLSLSASTTTGAQLGLCATDSQTGECLSAPVAAGVPVALESGGIGTYSVFVSANERLAFDPEKSRVNLQFLSATGDVRGATSIAIAGERKDWFAWRDYATGASTLRLTGDVVAGTPCHRALARVAPNQNPDADYLSVDVQLASTLSAGQACVQSLANIPLTFELPNYEGTHKGLLVRTPNAGTAVVTILDSL